VFLEAFKNKNRKDFALILISRGAFKVLSRDNSAQSRLSRDGKGDSWNEITS
jgi:hypothetical protein